MSLSELSYYVRRYAPVLVIGFVMFIVFFGVFRFLFAMYSKPAAEQAAVYQPPFGILEPIGFSHSIEYPADFTLTIDNIEGRPIDIASEGEVFFIPPKRTRFGYQQTVALMAKAVGINTEVYDYTLDGTTAIYKEPLRTLNIDITTYNFSFELDYKRIPTLFSNTYTPNEVTIKEEAKAFLRKMNKFTPDLAQGSQHIIYLRYEPATDEFIEVKAPEEANVVEVDFFTPDIKDWPVVSPKYFNSHTYVTLVFNNEQKVVIKSHVKLFDRDTSKPGTYPLKTGAQAWDELTQRKGVIVSPSKSGTDIVVREMFIGYYWADTYQPYLQPVYVFLGDNGFAAYVPAVQNTYVKDGLMILPTGTPTPTPQPTEEPEATPTPSAPEPSPVASASADQP